MTAPSHPAPVSRRLAPVLFALIMSTLLSGLMSAAITLVNTGAGAGFLVRWLWAYGLAWVMAFPLVTLLAPQVRRLVDALTAEPVRPSLSTGSPS
jgi:hypothetical protein